MARQQDRDPQQGRRRARGALSDPTGWTLRPPTWTDETRLYELLRDPDELAFGLPAFVPEVTSVREVRERIERARQAWDAHEPTMLIVVAPAQPDLLLGLVAWRRDVPPPFLTADIGYAVHPDARGRGVAAGAARLMIDWLMNDASGPGMLRVQLDHSVENPASCRVALAAGMEQEGVRRSYLPLRDSSSPSGVRRHDVCLHGIVATASGG